MADTTFILWIQQFATPWLDGFFRMVTLLGDEEYYILAIPLLYWLYSKRFALRFGAFFLLNAYLNSAIKHSFITERPPLELHKIEQAGFSFPSGHAQGNTAFWGYLAVQANQKWAYITAGILLSLVAFSRVYLGVHFPIDIIFGIAIGALLLAVYEYLSRNIQFALGTKAWLLLSSGIVFLLLMAHVDGDGPLTMGFALGALWGYRLETEFVGFEEKALWWQNVVKAVLGLVVLFALRVVLKLVLVEVLGIAEEGIPGAAITFVRYFVMGLWVTLLAPWLFLTLGLSTKTVAHQKSIAV